MATNEQIRQARESLNFAFRTEVVPRFDAVKRIVDDGGLYSEVESEITWIRNQFEQLYSQVSLLLEQARANDPQDPELIELLETGLNTRRNQNFAALASVEQRARDNESRQVARETDAQDSAAARDAGPGTSSAGALVTNSALAGIVSVSSPSLANQVLNTVGAKTNAVGALVQVPTLAGSPAKLPGAISPSSAAGQAISTGGSALSGAPGVFGLEPDTRSNKEQSYIYKLVQVTHNFRQGRFTQEIEGVLVNFDDLKTTKANTDADIQNGENFYGENVSASSQRNTTAAEPLGRVVAGAKPSATSDLPTNDSDPNDAFFGSGGQEVNYRPVDLASVKDQAVASPANLPAAAAQAVNATVPARRAPPTSSGQPVGTPSDTGEPEEFPPPDPSASTSQVIKGDD